MSSGSFFLPSFLRFHSRLSSEKARNSMAREMNPGSRKQKQAKGIGAKHTHTHTRKTNRTGVRRLVVSAQWRFLIDERRSAKVFVSHVVFSASTSVMSCSRLRYIGSRHFLVYFCPFLSRSSDATSQAFVPGHVPERVPDRNRRGLHGTLDGYLQAASDGVVCPSRYRVRR